MARSFPFALCIASSPRPLPPHFVVYSLTHSKNKYHLFVGCCLRQSPPSLFFIFIPLTLPSFLPSSPLFTIQFISLSPLPVILKAPFLYVCLYALLSPLIHLLPLSPPLPSPLQSPPISELSLCIYPSFHHPPQNEKNKKYPHPPQLCPPVDPLRRVLLLVCVLSSFFFLPHTTTTKFVSMCVCVLSRLCALIRYQPNHRTQQEQPPSSYKVSSVGFFCTFFFFFPC